MEFNSGEESEIETKSISLEDIANQLLKERFLLTSLEFHAELVESGREISKLRDYFSNPVNFEILSKQLPIESNQTSSGLNRSSSQTTLDSFDWARYSEDGERVIDERIAVLEFELRKAKETIFALRANLTQATTSNDELNVEDDINFSNCAKSSNLRPHQVRTLNFLINEYLLMRGYKMTAITFADENDNQDFENWDDVGLNIPRPPSLPDWMQSKIQIYDSVVESKEIDTQTDEDCAIVEKIEGFERTILELQSTCKKQKIELDKLRRRSSTPHITPLSTPPLDRRSDEVSSHEVGIKEANVDQEESPVVEENKLGAKRMVESSELNELMSYSEVSCNENIQSIEDYVDTPQNVEDVAQNVDTSNVDANAAICPSEIEVEEERFEVEGNSEVTTEDITEPSSDCSSPAEVCNEPLDPLKCSRLPPLGASSEASPIGDMAEEFFSAQTNEAKLLLRASSKRYCSKHLEEILLEICFNSFVNIDSRLQEDIVSLGLGQRDLLTLVADSLANIAPNVILAKREELLPLLVYTISEHSSSLQREKLLHLLFNLTKRPDKNQRRTILLGLVGIARVLGPSRLEAELLPQCWEQLTHKHPERRLLVAQSVSILAPYTPSSLRNSLLLSMLQQVLGPNGENDSTVRDAALSSLALLVAYLDDIQKLAPLIETLILCLENSELSFVGGSCGSASQPSSVLLLYSSLAAWSLQVDYFDKFLLAQLDRLNVIGKEIRKESLDCSKKMHLEQLTRNYLSLLCGLEFCCPYLISYLIKSVPESKGNLVNDRVVPSVANMLFIDEISLILNRSKEDVEILLRNLQPILTLSNVDDWPEWKFIANKYLPDLIHPLTNLDPSLGGIINIYISVINKLCCTFDQIRNEIFSPLFLSLLNVDENAIERIKDGATCLTKAPLVLYCVSILDKGDAFQDFISRQISLISLCGASTYAIEVTISLLLDSLNPSSDDKSLEEAILGSLWCCVVHRSPLVRSTSGKLWNLLIGRVDEFELASRVVPALVTLATDPNVTVKAAAIKPLSNIVAFSTNKDVGAKALLQLESLCDDALSLDSPSMPISIANACTELGHNAPQQLLHQVFLPCLSNCTLSARGSAQDQAAFGSALLEAFLALASCSMPDHVVAHFILPPLNYLQKTLGVLSQEHMETITLLTKEYTFRAQSARSMEKSRSNSSVGLANQNISHQVVDVKNKMSKMFSAGKAATSTAHAAKAGITLPAFFKKK